MTVWYRVENHTHPLGQALWVRRCADWWCRFLGLMFRASLHPQEGLWFTWSRPGRWQAAVHMWGMRFPLALVWLDPELRVVEVRLARPWRTVAVPRRAVQHLLELPASRLSHFHLGDRLTLSPDTPPWLLTDQDT